MNTLSDESYCSEQNDKNIKPRKIKSQLAARIMRQGRGGVERRTKCERVRDRETKTEKG